MRRHKKLAVRLSLLVYCGIGSLIDIRLPIPQYTASYVNFLNSFLFTILDKFLFNWNHKYLYNGGMGGTKWLVTAELSNL